MRFKVREACARHSRLSGIIAGIVIALAVAPAPAAAALRVWDGGGADNKWSTPANWDGNVAPSAGDVLGFPIGVAKKTMTNDFPANTAFQALLFAGDYIVQGNTLEVDVKIGLSTPDTVIFFAGVKIDTAMFTGPTIDVDVAENGVIRFAGVVTSDPFLGTLRKIGLGRMQLEAANDFSSGVWIQQGVVRVTHAAGLGTGVAQNSGSLNTTVEAGASLELAVTSGTPIAEGIVLRGLGTGAPGMSALTASQDATLTGRIFLLSDSDASIGVWNGKTLTLTGWISGTGSLVKNGPGTLRFASTTANAYIGLTSVDEGTLLLASDDVSVPNGLRIGDGNGGAGVDIVRLEKGDQIAGEVAIKSSGWLDLGNFKDTLDVLSIDGGKVSTTSIGLLSLVGNVTADRSGGPGGLIEGRLALGSATRTFTVTGTSNPALTVTASISGNASVGIIKEGNGALRLQGANTYTGPTIVANGALLAAHAQAFGSSSSGTIVQPGPGAIYLEADVPNEPLELNPQDDALYAKLLCNGAGSVCTWGGPIALNGGAVAVAAGSNSILRFTGIVGGAGTLWARAGGIVELGAANTYGGTTRVSNASVLRLNGSNRIPDSSDVLIESQSTLDLNGFFETVRGLSSSQAGAKVLLGGATLTVSPQSVDAYTFSGVISGIGGGLIKKGPGRLDLIGAQTYTNPTDVQAGTMRINGSLAGSLLLSSTASLRVQINGSTPNTDYDRIDVHGAVTLNNATLDLAPSPDLPLSALDETIIISNNGSDPVSGTFAGLTEGALITATNGKPLFHISYVGGDGNDVTLTPAVRDYYLSEGATGPFFDLDVLIANPNASAAPITLTFLTPGGGTVVEQRTIPAMTRITVRVDDVASLGATAVSTVVTSDMGLPLIVERTMRWDESGYGAHTEKAAAGAATNWYFAEGAQGYFSMYLLLANPQTTDNVATVQYLIEGEAPIVRTYTIKAQSRFTVDGSAEPELLTRSFGMHVTFEQPGVAERSMYFGRDPLWKGGHESAGVTAPAKNWFLAEGATGSFFETFILLANPSDQPANAEVTFLPSTGVPIKKTKTVPAFGRVTINIENEDEALKNEAVATQIASDRDILVERSQYWPGSSWYEAHNSFGVTQAGKKWGLAEGRTGGPEAYHTYILIANPGAAEASVTVTFLRENGQPFDKTFTVAPTSRYNIDTGPGTLVPELHDERFGALIVSDQPIAVERAMYSNANGQLWAAGTNATATALPD